MFTKMKHSFNRFRGRGEVGSNAEAYEKCKDHFNSIKVKYSTLKLNDFCGENKSEKMYMNSSRGYDSPFIANKFRKARIETEKDDEEENKPQPKPQVFYDDDRYGIDKQSGGSKRKKSKKKSRRWARPTRRR